MKKLMMTAAAVALAGAATAAQIADYKASVKYVNMQKKSVSYAGTKVNAYIKQVKSCTLKGYVVYSDCACQGVGGEYNPAWLVVKGSAQAKQGGKILPRILPADLLLRLWDPKMGAGKTIEAEGYLFAGCGKGSTCAGGLSPVAPWMADNGYGFGHNAFGTRFLFGVYNDAVGGTVNGNFFDAWLDHAGFGKADYSSEEGHCGEGTSGYCLKNLSGSVIGGLFLCYPNGYPYGLPLDGAECQVCTDFDFFPCHHWLGTTDVISGTWSMKRTTKVAEVAIVAADGSFASDTATYAALFPALKGAAVKLGAASLGYIDAYDNEAGATAAYIQEGNAQ